MWKTLINGRPGHSQLVLREARLLKCLIFRWSRQPKMAGHPAAHGKRNESALPLRDD
jgi:hypothetical protein